MKETGGRTSLRRQVTQLKKRLRPEVLYSFRFPLQVEWRYDVPGYRLVDAEAEHIKVLRSTYPRELGKQKAQLLRRRLTSESESCWVILDDEGRPCGYCHVALADTVNARINHRVRVGNAEAYFFDDYVVKKHRGKGLHTFSIAARGALLQSKGIRHGLTTISRKNTPSIASYRKFGTRRTETLVHLPALRRTLRIPARTSGTA